MKSATIDGVMIEYPDDMPDAEAFRYAMLGHITPGCKRIRAVLSGDMVLLAYQGEETTCEVIRRHTEPLTGVDYGQRRYQQGSS